MTGKGDNPENFIGESRYATVHKYSVFPRVYEENSKDLYKEQKVCMVCKVSVSGLIDKKKYFCAFCYNAVCQNCSPMRCNHPHTLKEERTCMQCYFNAIEINIKNAMKAEIDTKIGDEETRNSREVMENELHDLENEEQALDMHIEAAEEEVKRLEKLRNRVEDERNRKIKESEAKNNEEISKGKESLEKLQRDIASGREILRKQEEDMKHSRHLLEEKLQKIKSLQEEIEIEKKTEVSSELDSEPSDSRNPDKEQCIEELNHIKSLISQLQLEQAELQSKLSSQLKK